MGVQSQADCAGPLSENGERQKNPEKDVRPGQPDQTHSDLRRHTAESDNGRRGDKRRSVAERHHRRRNVASAGSEVVAAAFGPPQPAEKGNRPQIDNDDGDHDKQIDVKGHINGVHQTPPVHSSSIFSSSSSHFSSSVRSFSERGRRRIELRIP